MFVISRNMGMAKNRDRTPHFRRVIFQLFKELLDEIPWETVLGDMRTEHNWQLFKDAFLRVKELSIPQCKK